jgi:hypothetical protein
MPKFTSDLETTVMASGFGYHVPFKPSESKNVPEVLVATCLDLGLSPEDGDGDGKVGKTDDSDHVMQLVDAMFQVMAEGDKSKITSSGEPRHNVLEKLVGFKFTKAEREAAWDICSLKDAES